MSRELYVPSDDETIALNPKLLGMNPAVQPFFIRRIQACYRRNVPVKLVGGLRGPAEQQRLYEKGRKLIDGAWLVVDARAVVTLLQLGWHNFGLAGDLALLKTGQIVTWESADRDGDGIEDWQEVAKATEECGDFDAGRGEIGYYWKKFTDPPHAERHRGLSLEDAIARYHGGFDIVSGKRQA